MFREIKEQIVGWLIIAVPFAAVTAILVLAFK